MKEFLSGNEYELLLFCCRPYLNEADICRLHDLLTKEIDWQFFSDLVFYHKVAYLVYDSLKPLQSTEVPASLLSELRSFVLRNCARNVLLCQALFTVVSFLESHGIQVVPFKGPALSSYLYGNSSFRTSADIDILVPRKKIIQAVSLLTSAGYSSQFNFSETEYKVVFRVENQVALLNENSSVCIDMHWKLNDRSFRKPFDYAFIVDRLIETSLDNHVLKSLSSEDLLVYLCIHGSHHRWYQIDSICCVAALLGNAEEIDWRQVSDLVNKLGCKRILYTGLSLAHDLLGAGLPEKIVEEIDKNDKVLKQVYKLKENLFLSVDAFNKRGAYQRSAFYHLSNHDRLIDKLIFLIRLVFCPSCKDVESYSLPALFSFFYYLYRPVRLVVQYFSEKLKSNTSKGNRVE